MLLAAVVGSGIMGERLAGGNVAIALLANTVATGAALVALILTFEKFQERILIPRCPWPLPGKVVWRGATFPFMFSRKFSAPSQASPQRT